MFKSIHIIITVMLIGSIFAAAENELKPLMDRIFIIEQLHARKSYNELHALTQSIMLAGHEFTQLKDHEWIDLSRRLLALINNNDRTARVSMMNGIVPFCEDNKNRLSQDWSDSLIRIFNNEMDIYWSLPREKRHSLGGPIGMHLVGAIDILVKKNSWERPNDVKVVEKIRLMWSSIIK